MHEPKGFAGNPKCWLDFPPPLKQTGRRVHHILKNSLAELAAYLQSRDDPRHQRRIAHGHDRSRRDLAARPHGGAFRAPDAVDAGRQERGVAPVGHLRALARRCRRRPGRRCRRWNTPASATSSSAAAANGPRWCGSSSRTGTPSTAPRWSATPPMTSSRASSRSCRRRRRSSPRPWMRAAAAGRRRTCRSCSRRTASSLDQLEKVSVALSGHFLRCRAAWEQYARSVENAQRLRGEAPR